MAKKGEAIQLVGIEQLKKNLMKDGFLAREAHNLLRQAVSAVATDIRNEVRANIPPNVKHYKKAIATYRPRVGKSVIAAEVVAKRTPPRAFYLHNIVEHGTTDRYTKSGAYRGKVKAQPFKKPVVDRWRAKVPKRFQEHLSAKLEAAWAKRRTGVK